jgi:N-acetylglucosaminyl-diphospho-decaprenol L-rhamnosyltransferase
MKASRLALLPPTTLPDTADVSVTIVTFNCRDHVLACLATLPAGVVRHRYEVVVVDNGSTDGVVEAITERYPDVTVLERGVNDGFGRSQNLAVSRARGRHVLVLNPDTVVEPGAIDVLVELADRRRAAGTPVGVIAPQLLNPDRSDQRTARAFPTASAGLFGRRSPLTRWFPGNPWSRRFLGEPDGARSGPWTVDWVSGAAMLVSREEFRELGGFDPDFFMHFEDAELCHRVKASGGQVWCVPEARIVHDEGGSRNGWPVRQLWHFHRGAYLFARKSRYPSRTDPRRWGTGALLGARFVAVAVLGAARRNRESPGRRELAVAAN